MKRLLSFFWVPLFLLVVACTPTQPPAPTPIATATAVDATAGPQPSPSPTLPPASEAEEDFNQELANAIVGRDFEAMQAAMEERFTIAYWRSEGSEMTPAEAVESLRQSLFVQGSDPVTDFSIDVSGLLDGADPLLIFGPQSNAVRAFHITGLGADAAGEAIGVISRDPATGRLYWHGILVAMEGFQQPTEPVGELNAFGEGLAAAFEGRDLTALRGLMGERFSIATWNTQLLEFTSEEALQQLGEAALSAGSSPAVMFGTDVTALLEGTDPLSLWGPVANPVKAVYVMGLGHSSNEEAVLVIGQNAASGVYYWHGILLPPGGSFGSDAPKDQGDVLETDVEYVMALEDVNARSGPGLNYAVEGLVRAGQIAQVSGTSPDREWWRIVCTQDASGFCWISADPGLTEPTSAP